MSRNLSSALSASRASMLLLRLLALGVVAAVPADNDAARFALPDDLLIGAGVAAVQTEGAWNIGGKSESIVDYVIHSEKLGPFGYKQFHLHDKAADSYHRFKEDIECAAKLKMQVYRMSISWARVLPGANASNPNQEGVDYYHSFIDEILKYNMTPMVTIYHFDHPAILEHEFGGWSDRRMVDKFGEYTEFVLKEYGSKVRLWTTVNEPNVYCSYLNGLLTLAQGKTMDDFENVNVYPCLHYFILGHGLANKIFRQGNYEGKIGFTVTTLISRPASTSPEDIYASEVYNQMFAGMLLHPLIHGDYPQLVKDVAGDKLLEFTEDEKEMLKNSTDYIGLNVYYEMYVKYKDPSKPRRFVNVPMRQIFKDANFMDVGYRSVTGESLDDYPNSMVDPDAMRNALLWTWFTYKVPILITENGMGDQNMPGVHDHLRSVYHSAFMRAMVSAVNDFGVKVIGYCAWSLIDNFEWSTGFDRVLGLVHVDYEHGSLNRTLKDSASFWVQLAEQRVVPLVEPSSSATTLLTPATLLVAVTITLFNAA